MSDDALTMRGPVHGTKDARKVATRQGVAMTPRPRHRAAPPGPRHTYPAAPPCAAAASPPTMAIEYLFDNRSVPS